MSLKTFCILLIMLLVVSFSNATISDSAEVTSLNSLYDQLGGPDWNNSGSWGEGDPCDNEWYGVTCLEDTTVNRIFLPNNNLVGVIPETLYFPNLYSLYLAENDLEGAVPSFNLPELQYLYLHQNRLTGELPDWNLPKLDTINVSDNEFTGPIPNWNMPELREIHAHSNELSGPLPLLESCQKLEYLSIKVNSFQSPLPDWNFPELRILLATDAGLIGPLPQLISLPSVSDVWLDDNQITGPLPDWSFPTINTLKLSYNQLSGSIPNYSMPTLTTLYLDSNMLSGALPSFDNLENLKTLQLRFNNLCGPLPNDPPATLGNDLSGNVFQCPLPDWCASAKCGTCDDVQGVCKCPDGTLGDGDNCQPCDSSCATCVNEATSCTSCANGLVLYMNQCLDECPELMIEENGVCVCRDGTFDVGVLDCQPCDSSCATCVNEANSCTSCANGLVLHMNQCLDECPEFMFGENGVCRDCHENCFTCDGSSSSDCLSCDNDSFLSSGSCVDSCDSSEYSNEETRECEPCHGSCLTCDGNLPTDCLSCGNSAFLKDGSCVDSCDSSEYSNEETRECEPCHESCLTCDGPSSTNCSSCGNSMFMQEGSCVETCEGSVLANEVLRICEPCHDSCLTCEGTSSSECLTCDDSAFFQFGKCVESCSASFYLDEPSRTCLPCHSTCESCNGGEFDECLSCGSDRVLQNGECVDVSCDGKFYENAETNSCEPCSFSCASCSGGSPNDCLTCELPRFFHESQCVSSCPEGTFGDTSTIQCESCSPRCTRCMGASEDECNECEELFFLHDNQCVNLCPSGFFASESGTCISCDAVCATCDGPAESDCNSCHIGFSLMDNECVVSCPEGFIDVNGVCELDTRCNSPEFEVSDSEIDNQAFLADSPLEFEKICAPGTFGDACVVVGAFASTDIAVQMEFSTTVTCYECNEPVPVIVSSSYEVLVPVKQNYYIPSSMDAILDELRNEGISEIRGNQNLLNSCITQAYRAITFEIESNVESICAQQQQTLQGSLVAEEIVLLEDNGSVPENMCRTEPYVEWSGDNSDTASSINRCLCSEDGFCISDDTQRENVCHPATCELSATAASTSNEILLAFDFEYGMFSDSDVVFVTEEINQEIASLDSHASVQDLGYGSVVFSIKIIDNDSGEVDSVGTDLVVEQIKSGAIDFGDFKVINVSVEESEELSFDTFSRTSFEYDNGSGDENSVSFSFSESGGYSYTAFASFSDPFSSSSSAMSLIASCTVHFVALMCLVLFSF